MAGVAGQLLKLQLLLLIWRKTRLYSEEMKKNIHIPGHSRDKKVFIGFSPPPIYRMSYSSTVCLLGLFDERPDCVASQGSSLWFLVLMKNGVLNVDQLFYQFELHAVIQDLGGTPVAS